MKLNIENFLWSHAINIYWTGKWSVEIFYPGKHCWKSRRQSRADGHLGLVSGCHRLHKDVVLFVIALPDESKITQKDINMSVTLILIQINISWYIIATTTMMLCHHIIIWPPLHYGNIFEYLSLWSEVQFLNIQKSKKKNKILIDLDFTPETCQKIEKNIDFKL